MSHGKPFGSSFFAVSSTAVLHPSQSALDFYDQSSSQTPNRSLFWLVYCSVLKDLLTICVLPFSGPLEEYTMGQYEKSTPFFKFIPNFFDTAICRPFAGPTPAVTCEMETSDRRY
jgi:hypothetical protein